MKNVKRLLSIFVLMGLTLSCFSVFAGCTGTDMANGTVDTEISVETKETIEQETTFEPIEIIVTSDEERIYETMDYKFIPDEKVIGKWESVDFVANIEDFDPNQRNFEDTLYYLVNTFFDDGTLEMKFTNGADTTKWTRGYIDFPGWQVIPAYEIKNIDDNDYLFIEWKSGDYYFRGEKPLYYVFKRDMSKQRIRAYDDVRRLRGTEEGYIYNADLSDFGKEMYTLWFNEKTIFPPDDRLPQFENYKPATIMEKGKNPGLGVRSIHEQGITGKGVNVAIIDQPLYVDSHPEYKGKIIEYKDFDCNSESSMHGPAVTSLLVGETTGTAPGAKIYYAAAPSWKGDATYYADALDWIVETNKSLPESEKIRVVSVSAAPSGNPDFTNGEKWRESVNRAKEANILVLDCTSEFGIIGGCKYDYLNPEDLTKCTTGWQNTRAIFAPMDYRTSAEEYTKGDCSYQYSGQGGLSWAIPYVAGVLAMGWEVNPALMANEIVQILIDTAYVDNAGYKYINPIAFIDYLKAN